MYRSASNHHHFRYDCSFLLRSLIKIVACRKQISLYTVCAPPAFTKSAALKSDLLRDILEAQIILPICGCMAALRWIGRELFYELKKEGSFP